LLKRPFLFPAAPLLTEHLPVDATQRIKNNTEAAGCTMMMNSLKCTAFLAALAVLVVSSISQELPVDYGVDVVSMVGVLLYFIVSWMFLSHNTDRFRIIVIVLPYSSPNHLDQLPMASAQCRSFSENTTRTHKETFSRTGG
jgi:hypothetical protein